MTTMGPFNLVIPTAKVKVSDESSFSVRGFSFDDAMRLYHRHAAMLSPLFDQFAGRVQAGVPVTSDEVIAAGADMLRGTPRVMAEILAISVGADPAEDDSFAAIVAQLLQLPLGTQMIALREIAALTFSSEMPPGKFIGLVLETARSTTAALSQTRRT
jgi:hypothetical protein